eukprot:1146512-Pelagomonas_calceolata.AAC.1
MLRHFRHSSRLGACLHGSVAPRSSLSCVRAQPATPVPSPNLYISNSLQTQAGPCSVPLQPAIAHPCVHTHSRALRRAASSARQNSGVCFSTAVADAPNATGQDVSEAGWRVTDWHQAAIKQGIEGYAMLCLPLYFCTSLLHQFLA